MAKTDIKEALNQYNDLKKQLDAGKLTQADFISQVGGFLPEAARLGNEWASQGSGQATTAKGEGLEDLYKATREYNAYASGQDLLGRDITKQELADFLPKFSTFNDVDTGRAYIGELAQREAKSPASLEKKAPAFSGQVTQTFKDLLGRDPTANENDYYGRLLATGNITPYEIEELVKKTPDYQTKQDTAFRGDLSKELQGYGTEAFGKAKEDILSRYKRAGIEDSSGLDFALSNAAGDIESERQRYLTGLSSQQYGGNKAMAVSDYQDVLDRFIGGQNYGVQRSDAKLDYLTGRTDASLDYNRQMEDYLAYLTGQPKKGGNKGQNAMTGAASGAAIGTSILPGWGTAIGAVGGGLFGYRS